MTRRTFFSALAGIAAALAFPCKRRAASVTATMTTTGMNQPVYTLYRHTGSCLPLTPSPIRIVVTESVKVVGSVPHYAITYKAVLSAPVES